MVLSSAGRLLGVLRRLRSSLNAAALSAFYLAYIRPKIEYADTAWSNMPGYLADRLERFQRKAARIVLGLPMFTPINHTDLLTAVGWPTLTSRRKLHLAQLAHALHHRTAPQHILTTAFPTRHHHYPLRHQAIFDLPIPHTSLFRDSPLFLCSAVYNSLPQDVCNLKTPLAFRKSAAELLLTSSCTCSSHPPGH